MRAGCERCWATEPEAAWDAFQHTVRIADWVEREHHSVRLRACSRCGQRYVVVFDEQVDWVNGDDPQYWLVVPVEADEAAVLARSGAESIRALARTRRVLHRDFPAAAPAPVCRWNLDPES